MLEYLIHFSRTSLTNLGFGFSRSTVRQSDLIEDKQQINNNNKQAERAKSFPFQPHHHSPVIPAPPKLEVAQVVRKPVD